MAANQWKDDYNDWEFAGSVSFCFSNSFSICFVAIACAYGFEYAKSWNWEEQHGLCSVYRKEWHKHWYLVLEWGIQIAQKPFCYLICKPLQKDSQVRQKSSLRSGDTQPLSVQMNRGKKIVKQLLSFSFKSNQYASVFDPIYPFLIVDTISTY